MSLEIPDALFTKPKLIAEIKVPDEAVSQEQVTDNIEEAIKSVTGLEMRVYVVEPEDEEE